MVPNYQEIDTFTHCMCFRTSDQNQMGLFFKIVFLKQLINCIKFQITRSLPNDFESVKSMIVFTTEYLISIFFNKGNLLNKKGKEKRMRGHNT